MTFAPGRLRRLVTAWFGLGLALMLPALATAFPTVNVTTPGLGTQYISGTETFRASASDPADSIQRVEYLFPAGVPGNPITSFTAPYEVQVDTTAITDGVGVVQVTAFNTLGQQSAPDIRVYTFDNSPPNVPTMTAPVASPQALFGLVDVGGFATDPHSQIDRIEVFVGGAAQPDIVGGSGTVQVNTASAAIPDGALVQYRLDAYNNAGLGPATFAANFVTDNSPPVLNLAQLSPNPTSGVIPFQIDAIEPHSSVVQVSLEVAGNIFFADATGTSPLNPTFDSAASGLDDGVYTFTAKAQNSTFDPSGESVAQVTVTFDNSPPDVTITSPSSNQVFGNTVSVTASVVETTTAIQSVMFEITGNGLAPPLQLFDSSPPFSTTFPSALLNGDGTYTVAVTATNTAQLANSPPPTVNFIVDETAPNVSLDNPVTDPMAGNIFVSASASDNGPAGLQSVQLRIGSRIVGNFTDPFTGPFQATVNSNDPLNPILDGSYAFQAIATDKAGNSLTDTIPYVVDNSPPQVTLFNPSPNSQIAGPFDIQATAFENFSNVQQVRILVDGSLQATLGAPPFEIIGFDPVAATIPDGDRIIRVEADNDIALLGGNPSAQTTSREITVTIDNSAPNTTLLTPTAGVLAGLTPMQASADDPHSGIAQVEFYIRNGQTLVDVLVGTDTVGPPWLIQANTLPFPDGFTHDFWAVAENGAGLRTPTATFTLEIDNTPPTGVTILAPLPNEAITGNAYSVNFTATETHSFLDRVELIIDGALAGTYFGVGPLTIPLDTTIFPEGAHTLAVVAYNGANLSTQAGPIPIRMDNSPPSVFMTNPSTPNPVRGLIDLQADAFDLASDIQDVEFFVDGSPAGPVVTTPPWVLVDYDTTGLSNGDHDFFAVATNQASLVSTSATITVTVDNLPPLVSLDAPFATTSVHGTIALSATASDLHTGIESVTFFVSDDPFDFGIARAILPSPPYSTNFLTTQLDDGDYYFRARADDGVGNQTYSTPPAMVTVDNSAPTVFITSPTVGYFTGALNIFGFVEDTVSGVPLTEFFVDGNLFGTSTTSPNVVSTLLTTGVSDGFHQFWISAANGAGLISTSTVVTLGVDNSPPIVSFDAPLSGAFSGSVDFLGSVTEPHSGITDFFLFMDGIQVLGTASGPPWDVSVDTFGVVTDGPHDFFFRAVNGVGLVADSTPTVNLIIDNSEPATFMVTPTTGMFTGVVSLEASAIDTHSGIVSVDFLADGATVATTTLGPPYIVQLDTSTLPFDGTYSLESLATNGAGLTMLSTFVTVIFDNSPPDTFLLEPVDAFLTGTYTWQSDVSDFETGIQFIEYTIDGTPVATSSANPFSLSSDSALIPDGLHVFGVRATNGVSLTAISTFEVLVDNSAPAVLITSPTTGDILVGSFDFTGTVSDVHSGVSYVDFFVGSTNVASISTPPTSVAELVDPPNFPIADGTYTLELLAEDNVGLQASSLVTVTIENSGPIVTITSPTVDPVTGNFPFDVSAVEPHTSVTMVEFFIDGSVIGSDITSPYSTSVASLGFLTDGPHDFHARAVNVVGLETYSTTNTVIVDNSLPTAYVVAPVNNGFAGGDYTLMAFAEDLHTGVGQVEYLLGLAPNPTTPVATSTAGGSWDATLVTTTLADGSYYLRVQAVNGVGLTTVSSDVFFTLDNSAPTITLTTPTTGGFYAGVVDFQSTPVDIESNITSVEYFVGGISAGTTLTAPWLLSVDTAALGLPGDGPYVVAATATNGASLTATVTAPVTIDNSGPQLVLTSPTAGPLTGSFDMTATATDVHTLVTLVDFLVDGSIQGSDATSPYAHTGIVTATLPDGVHNFQARAINQAGSVTLTPITSFVVDNSPPIVSVVSPGTTYIAGLQSFVVSAIETHTSVSLVEFTLDGVPIGSDAFAAFTTAIDTQLLADGPITFGGTATNTVSLSATALATFVVDNSPPDVSLTSPDPTTASVTARATLAAGRFSAAAAQVGNDVWVAGGQTGVATILGSVERYDIGANTWAAGPALAIPRAGAFVGAVGGRVVVAGGVVAFDTPLSDAAILDPAGPTWAVTMPLGVLRGRGASAVVDDKLYAIGGITSGGNPSAATEVYDPATGTWTLLNFMPTARSHMAAGVWNEKIYVVGGQVSGGAATDIVEVFDTATGTWSSAPSLVVPMRPEVVVSRGGRLLAIDPATGLIQALEFATGGWVVLGTWPTTLTGRAWVDTGLTTGQLAIGGTTNGASGSNLVDRYDFPNSVILAGVVPLAANPVDPHSPVDQVDFLSGAATLASSTAAPWAASYDFTGFTDGLYDLRARGTNRTLQSSDSPSYEFFFQQSAPSVSLSTPDVFSGALTGVVSFAATATDFLLVEQVEFLVNGSPVATDTVRPYAASVDTSALPTSGLANLQVRAFNRAGNQATSSDLFLVIDNTPPTVSISAPTGGFVSGPVTIVALPADPDSGIKQVDFFYGPGAGTLLGTDALPPTYTTTFDTTLVPGGSTDIRVEAVNFAGLVTTATTTVTIDNTPPVLVLETPSAGPVSGFVLMTANPAEDPESGLVNVEFLVNGSVVQTVAATPFQHNYDSSVLPPGLHNFQARATNNAGSVTVTPITSYQVDNTPPVVSYVGPTPGPVRGLQTFQGTAVDAQTGISSFVFDIAGAPGSPFGPVPGGPNYSLPIDTSLIPDGVYNVFVQATNGGGQPATSGTFPIEFDNSVDTITLTSPTAGPIAFLVDLTATATDINGIDRVEFLVDGTLVGTDNTGPSPYTHPSFDTGTLVDGGHTFTARAFDTLGNFQDSSAAVTVDNPDPPDLTLGGDGEGGNGSDITGAAAGIADTVDAQTVTVTIRDPSGVALPNLSPVLASSHPEDVITPLSASTNAAGQRDFSISTPRRGTAIYTATLGGVSLQDTHSITWANVLPTAAIVMTPAGPTMNPGALTLDGSTSSDVNGDALLYAWSTTAGTPDALLTPTAPAATALLRLAGAYTFRLDVDDQVVIGSDDFATVNMTVLDVAPVANAGPDIIVDVAVGAALDARASTDGNGDALTFAWTKVSGPAGDTITGAGSSTPTITFAATGLYEYQVQVTSSGGSDTDTVFVTVNSAADALPVADAGLDQSVQTNTLVTLTGAGSVDPDGGAIATYAWTPVSGPPVALTGAGTVNPTFTPTVSGAYVFQLVVTDDETDTSLPDQVTVTVFAPGNGPPTACAAVVSPAGAITVGATVQLSAACSSDPDGQALSYDWDLMAPTNTANIGAAVSLAYVPVVPGIHHLTLTVSDGGLSDTVDVFLAVSAPGNGPPTVVPSFSDSLGNSSVAGSGSSAVGALVTMAANATDPDGDPLGFLWSQQGGPSALLSAVNVANPTFTPSLPGTYHFRVFASDGTAAVGADLYIAVSAPGSNIPVAVQTSVINGVVGQFVILNGVGSFDPDGDPITHSWVQTGGPVVTLAAPSSATPSFVPASVATYTFDHYVSDGTFTSPPGVTTVFVSASSGGGGGGGGPGLPPGPGAPILGEGGGGGGGGGGCNISGAGPSHWIGLFWLWLALLGSAWHRRRR